jgi:photosystem II stability/assembly factor-like uncharacterized protein
MKRIRSRRAMVALTIALVVLAALAVGRIATRDSETALPRAASEFLREGSGGEHDADAGDVRDRDFQESSQGVENGGSGGEAFEALTAASQWAQARTAPSGLVNPGAYGAAFADLRALPSVGGSWQDVTALPYNADDPAYRDYYSNSSGGAGSFVTGRITGLAADDQGHVYAGAANGGVWRSSTGGGNWTPMADGIPSLSTGDLELGPDGALWYATGEANTGGTSYVGDGVYRLTNPQSGTFTPANRVGGDELESTTINAIRFAGGKAWAATSRGIWWHSDSTNTGAWTMSFAPNPAALTQPTDTNAPYKNIVNDVAIDPKNPNHLVAAIGWRSGDTYNGFYETTDGGAHWTKINPTGAINPKDIGNVSFAFASDGSKLYVMNQSPVLLNKLTGTVNSYLDGIYVSNNGSPSGPWSKIAEQRKLANSGSALKQSLSGKGYGPGIQSWYNQFLIVDPSDANHVYAGLEEVYETKNAGSSWSTVGPYWNFYFSCWAPDSVYPGPLGAAPAANRCPLTTHPDQHSAAIGKLDGTPVLYVGNDGGVYRRPIDGAVNGNGNATDWVSLNDGTMDALQYYSVDVGNAVDGYEFPPGSGNVATPTGTDSVIVSGGMQDNGGSVTRIGGANPTMSSNFGGDGGDTLVDPENGCRIMQEYVYLSLELTESCAHPNDPAAFLDRSKATTYDVAPPDVNARFIAPFVDNDTNTNQWLAGGASVWFQDKGYAIRSGSEWKQVHSWGSPVRVTTALAMRGDTAIAAWCGQCNNNGFARGAAVGTYDSTAKTWSWTDLDLGASNVPNRYVSGVAVDDDGNLYLALNGFSRRFTEGPGAGIGHLFKSTDGGATWSDVSGDMPDIPANSVQVLADGKLVVGTDLGVIVSSDDGAHWSRLGDNFPATVAIDVEEGPDGRLYAATHGRGIWRIATP